MPESPAEFYPAAPLTVGSLAPDFTLRDQNNRPVTLSELLREKSVLIIFFPLAFTGTCQSELGEIRDRLDRFEGERRAIVAISVSAPPVHRIWSVAQGYLFPILSDFWPHGEVARRYGVMDADSGLSFRGTFLVDRNRRIVFAQNTENQVRDQQSWLTAWDTIDSSR